jgi:predicted Zn finger-like uncharacterized protein
MQIDCPNCKTSYQIDDVAIGASGRPVRCVRCQTKWHATVPAIADPAASASADAMESAVAFSPELDVEPPVPDEPAAATLDASPSEPPAEPSLDDLIGVNASDEAMEPVAGVPAEMETPVALSDIPIPVEHATPLEPTADGDWPAVNAAEMDNGPPDIESVAARRADAAARKRRLRWRVPLPVAIVVLLALSTSLLGFRKHVVRHAPQLASFYSAIGMPVNVRGLAFTDLKIGNEIHDGVPVLVVEGMIVSMVSMPVDVPQMRFALRSATGAEVYSWTAQPSQPSLGAFETLPFRSRLASPPAEGHDIQVRFFTRRDAVAGLR